MPEEVSWLNDQLALGGRVSWATFEALARERGVGRIVDLRAEGRDDPELLAELGMELLHLPTPDFAPISARELDMGVDWVLDGVSSGRGVYIHCQKGIGRSAMLAWCVLVKMGEAPERALIRIKAARGLISPSPAQIEGVLRWTRENFPHLADGELDFGRFARIAYGPPPGEGRT